jgi:hypothetical protein
MRGRTINLLWYLIRRKEKKWEESQGRRGALKWDERNSLKKTLGKL